MIYIWMRAEGLTSSYHDGGGLLVSAVTLDEAREVARADRARRVAEKPTYEEFAPDDDFEISLLSQPDHVWESSAPLGTVLIFPDAGCC